MIIHHTEKTQQQHDIDAAMAAHLQTLRDACFDMLAALLTIFLGFISLIHAIVRVVYALVGLTVWTLGVWIIALQALQTQCIQRSSSSPFRREEACHADER